jgi:hypothetical protein
MVMSVSPFQRLHRHTQVTGGLPNWCALLHQPRCCGVPKCVRDNFGQQSRKHYGVFETRLYGFDRGSVPFNEMRCNHTSAYPTPHVGEEASRNWSRGLTLIILQLSSGQSKEDSFLKINEGMTNVSIR